MHGQANEDTRTSDATTRNTFHHADLNFTRYNQKALRMLCEHNVLVRTSFPKLAIHLFETREPHNKLQTLDKNESDTMTYIIEAINKHTDGTTPHLAEDSPAWKAIVGEYTQMRELRENHEEQVVQKVEMTLKSNIYRNADDTLVVQQRRRTRKQRVSHEPSDKRYGRLITIS